MGESEDESTDNAPRLVELSFASNKPIQHWFGFLELDMNAKSVRLERLKLGGALLWNHCADDQIGVVEAVTLTSEKASATCKFSRSECGEENYQDVLDGIKRNVSVGFIPYTIEQKVDKNGKQIFENGEPVYISRDWEPFEISLVSIPADISVGVGRSLDKFEEQRKMPEENTIPTDNPATVPPVQPVTRTEPNPTLTRIDHFLAIGERFGQRDLAQRLALDANKTEADLIREIGQTIPNTQLNPPAAAETIAQRNGQQPSALARVNYRVNLKSFKGENAQENAYRSGMWLKAVFNRDGKALAYCEQNGLDFRSQNSGQNENGGFLVPVEMENTLIDLRILYGVFRANANVVPMASDTLIRPRRVSGLTAYFVADEAAITESSKGWDSITLNAKELGVLAKYTQNVSDDAIISLADDLANEIGYSFANKEDECGFNGDGTSTYGGIVGLKQKFAAATAGVQTAAGATYASVTLANLNSLIGLLPQFARRSDNLKFYCSHGVYANVLVRLAQAVGGVTYGEISGMLQNQFFGIPVEIVEVMPSTGASGQICLYYGNLSMASTMGERRGVTVDQTNSHDTDFAKRLMTIRGTERFDINVHDVGDATNAGALVALKLA